MYGSELERTLTGSRCRGPYRKRRVRLISKSLGKQRVADDGIRSKASFCGDVKGEEVMGKREIMV